MLGVGAKVVYAQDPGLYGIGTVNKVRKDGWHEVMFEDCTELFMRGELERLEVFAKEKEPAKA